MKKLFYLYCVLLAILAGLFLYWLYLSTQAYSLPQDLPAVEEHYAMTKVDSLECFLYEELKDCNFPDIAYGIALLETGRFTSTLCLEGNNLFGLYNSRERRYCKFGCWEESIEVFKKIDQKFEGSTEEEYYGFLEDLPYATDKNYVEKLKLIVKDLQRI